MYLKFFSFCLICVSSFLYAQMGSISGTITDDKNVPLNGINLMLNDGFRKAATDENGFYKFEKLPQGSYTLQISESHIKDVHDFYLNENQHITFNYSSPDKIVSLGQLNVLGKDNKNVSNSLRLSEDIVNIPQNIQIVDNDMLNDQMLTNAAGGWTKNVSGVRTVLHQEETKVGIAIRGFRAGNMRNGMNVDGSFGPLREDLSFVERIEFVKGPAGFMMGNTQPGGFYNVVTKKPTGMNRGSVQLMMGSFGLKRATADIEGNLNKSKSLSGRINIMGTQSNSYQQFVGSEQYAINPSLRYSFSDNTSITAEYIFNQNNFTGGFAKYVYGLDGFKEVDRSFTFSDPIMDPTRVHEHNVFTTIEHQFNPQWNITGRLGYVRQSMEGKSLYAKYNSIVLKDDPATGAKKGDVIRQVSVNDNLNEITSGQIFVRGQFKVGDVNNHLLTGLDAGNNLSMADWSPIPVNVGDVFNIYNPVYKTLTANDIPSYDRSKPLRERGAYYMTEYQYQSVYLQDEIRFLNDNLRVSAGARYTTTEKISRADKGHRVKNYALTPRFGVTAIVQPGFSIYAMYDETFEEQAGTLLDGSSANPSFGKNKEIGLKKEWLNGKLFTTLSFYHLNKTNILNSAGPSNPGLFEQTGESVSKGVEFDLNGKITPSLSVMFNYAYTDAKVTKDKNENRVGAMLFGTAKHISNGQMTYTFRENTLKGLGLMLGYEIQAKRAAWPVVNDHPYLPDDYFTLDAGISYQQSKYKISLLVKNLTDRYNYVGFYPGAWGYKHYGWRALEPINYRINLSYSF